VTIDGEPVVRLRGELDLSTAPELARVLDALLEGEVADVALDISGLSFIDSSGISALITAQQDLHKRGRRLSVRSPRPTAVKVFEIAGLMDFLNVESVSPQNPTAGRG
jgi:anti-anti-sigma factor